MPDEKPSSRRGIFLAMGEIPAVIARTIIAILFMYYLTDLAGINPLAAGVIIMLGRLWDAFLDPVSAAFSDRVRLISGKRRTSMLVSSLPMGFFFLLLWHPWDVQPPFITATLFTITLVLFMSSLSLFYIPFQLMLSEFDGSPVEKKSLTMYRLLFLFIFGLAAAVVPKACIDVFSNPEAGFRYAGAGTAVIISVSAILVYALSGENTGGYRPADRYLVFKKITGVFRDRALASLVLITCGGFAAVHVLEGTVLYYMKYWIRSEKDMPFLFLAVIVSSVVTMPAWGALSRWLGSKCTLCGGLVFWALSQLLWLTLTPSSPAWIIIGVGAVAGVGYGCIHVLPQTILVSMIDKNTAGGGGSREADYPAIISLITKTGNAFALLLVGVILYCTGFVPNRAFQGIAREAVCLTLALLPLFFIIIALAGSAMLPSSMDNHK